MKQYFRNLWLFVHFNWLYDPVHMPGGYKANWGPTSFLLLVYWWDYGAACLIGRGVQSLSRAFKLLGPDHWSHTGGILFESVDLWERKLP